MKVFIKMIFLFFLTLGFGQSKSKPITEFSQNDTDIGILIDVRTPKEFQKGHLMNAMNIDWFGSDFIEKCQQLDRDNPVYVYCKKGGRSAKAASLLDSLGFKAVIDLEGGYDAYLAEKER